MKKERNKWEIILDILKVTKEEKKVKETQIMQRANLDWRIFQQYYNFLIEEGLIVKCSPENDCYMLTETGGNLLNKLKEVSEVLEKGNSNTSILSRIFASVKGNCS
jgi:predicted transcriptional regulator